MLKKYDIIFCTSVGQIPFALHYIDQNTKVVTVINAVTKFLTKYYNVEKKNIIELDLNNICDYALKNIFKNLYIKLNKNYIFNKYFCDCAGLNILYFSHYYPGLLYLIEKLSKRNKISFYDVRNYVFNYQKKSFVDRYKSCLVKFNYGIKITYITYQKTSYGKISEDYLNKNNITIISEIITDKTLSIKFLDNYDIKNIKVLLLPVKSKNIFCTKGALKLWKDILHFLSKKYKAEDIIVKFHPNDSYQLSSNIFDNLNHISSEIPAELLINHNYDYIIMAHSNSLHYIFNNKNRNTNVICIMKLFEYFNKSEKSVIFKSFKSLEAKIKFPDCLSSLKAEILH
ncbi:MAG: hypothetical protein CMM02_06360 [Rhodopirellula sp.]|nr:hypothetical protein [Rhodopirellula sp.]